ncbi:hypothetical protein D3C75_819060 [compost metagenome]
MVEAEIPRWLAIGFTRNKCWRGQASAPIYELRHRRQAHALHNNNNGDIDDAREDIWLGQHRSDPLDTGPSHPPQRRFQPGAGNRCIQRLPFAWHFADPGGPGSAGLGNTVAFHWPVYRGVEFQHRFRLWQQDPPGAGLLRGLLLASDR